MTAIPFLDERIETHRINRFSYASRKEPEFMNHRLVRCATCSLVFADRPPTEHALADAYHAADYDSVDEAEDAAATYALAIEPVLDGLPGRHSALEIGAGTGAFLDHLEAAGFTTLVGVEPSAAALAAAPPHRRVWLTQAVFRKADFAESSFDLICCFMTMEHVREPGDLAIAAMRLLRPGGAFVVVAHDHRSPVNRLLGKRSPIIDIEHLQIFSRRSLQVLYERTGFERFASRSLVNRYALRYWLRLMPLPSGLKRSLTRVLVACGLENRKLGIDVGNVIAVGYKHG